MSRTVLRALVRTAFVLVAAGSINAGCSRQAEGERCDLEWAGQTQDCDSGLVCTACGDLQDQPADRCCPPNGTFTDARCAPASAPTHKTCSTHAVTTVQTPGSAGSGTTAGAGGSGAAAGSGATSGTGGSDVNGGTGDMSASGAGNGG
jgi:hypothetical protein